jgi:putative hydrolase of the HAD superfamily
MLREAGVADDPTVVAELIELERSFLEEGVHLFEDSLPFLRELRARDVRTAVVSNCSHSTRPIVERLRLEDEADAVVLSFEVRVAKPEPGIYLEALERVKAEPAEALFVDDQVRYCDGAVAVGTKAVLIDRGRNVVQEAGAVGYHPTVAGLREVLELL